MPIFDSAQSHDDNQSKHFPVNGDHVHDDKVKQLSKSPIINTEKREHFAWDGTVENCPDEDTLEELALAEINKQVIKFKFDQNQDVVKEITDNHAPILLCKMSQRMRTQLIYMQFDVRIYA
jgi:hypothetical protein